MRSRSAVAGAHTEQGAEADQPEPGDRVGGLQRTVPEPAARQRHPVVSTANHPMLPADAAQQPPRRPSSR